MDIVLQAPVITAKKAGRPKTKKIREEGELTIQGGTKLTRRGRKKRCGICQTLGHTRKSCKQHNGNQGGGSHGNKIFGANVPSNMASITPTNPTHGSNVGANAPPANSHASGTAIARINRATTTSHASSNAPIRTSPRLNHATASVIPAVNATTTTNMPIRRSPRINREKTTPSASALASALVQKPPFRTLSFLSQVAVTNKRTQQLLGFEATQKEESEKRFQIVDVKN
ncbi:hypothetical protein Tsubulata_008452 [Turnera subulata]|uniref:Uncharacterized protein n=1 Tax=Turnera subulata TaxID=218843 RepID=A0A9Q0JDX9_9ROSI|nr:hypothetical protein Tsubulata_008452 [Turnera subulata]